MFSACPNIARNLEMLAGTLAGAEKAPHKCPPMGADPITAGAEVREHLKGSLLAIVGVGGSSEHCARALRALQHAARSHHCALVVTEDSWQPVTRWFHTQPPGEAKFLASRVVSAILVGEEENFPGFGLVFPKASPLFVGGLGWADTTRTKIAAHLRSQQTN